MSKDFPGAFAALRRMLAKHASGLIVLADGPNDYSVITPALGPNKKPMWFAAVLSKKSAVTYHLLPLYYNPRLDAAIPPELRARKQGKACFNFQRPDPALFAQLDELTRIGREQWERAGFLEPGLISRERLAALLKSSGEDLEALARQRKRKAAAATAKRASTLAKRTKAPSAGAQPKKAKRQR